MSTTVETTLVPRQTLDDIARLAQEFAASGCGAPPTQGSPSDADSREAYAAYGKAGLIGMHWPVRFGGRGFDSAVTFAVEEKMGYQWLPMSSYLLSVKTIGNALLQYATEQMCAEFIPRIASGELIFCQGFSEPEAGTDLGSLRTVARRDGDRYIVNGHKIWTSSAEYADWVYLAVRTGSTESRHRGLSVFLVDMNTPGIHVDVHRTLGGGTIGELTLTDVAVPADQVVGEIDGGWTILMGTLDYERVTSEKVGVMLRLLDEIDPLVVDSRGRQTLDRIRGDAHIAREHGRRATERLAAGVDASAESSMAKLSIAVLMQELAAVAVELVGPRALIESGPGAVVDGKLAAFGRAAVATTIAGGVSDIQRKNISRRRIGSWS
ncbi:MULTISPECIES: acyl-CoA dehydrogenase family protein [unclassified Mycolicibacterium]|uniref:acyl-CoA dehydrogenase family protein n=1 Tax=unclassified Mycolicibacterium TaxID=2636767 RepID=UPI0012DF88FE|nr:MULTISPECIES: acyl-CoA dehydrogenase family protein [unclassified Mycolicibacterium]MUL82240.1 acyl-CoA dehydrogenase [Mycolicibacterium sp. CBMA 329]MUL88006.1 acyl-CoA dehydrogenase [Mycolicibacterium sp. CBMA 331]MUM02336.1 acyl-CoA dehydrogenase [Mycolicibacterium sp. CBMA 334]MUM26351.1 acyl-CoA dehydrogenase [Mycolicibacterium sp. CBMA 295]MUM38303.1 acyl-CoA dehydrogenase [Mycolicibacterium sp. CBMA 247]